jgi:hypothetical protein
MILLATIMAGTKVDRGVTQVDPLSLILFNIIIDAILRELCAQGFDASVLFYADSGLIAGTDRERKQQMVDAATTYSDA